VTNPPPLLRFRITYAKSGSQRFIGHLDLLQTWERALRRAGIPIAYTQGFHPQPRIHLACALPLGFSSLGEVMDVWVERNNDPGLDASLPGDPGIPQCQLQAALPVGLQISAIEQVDLKAPALQTQVWAADYRVEILDPVDLDELAGRITTVRNASTLIRQRRGKTYDLRPLILELGISKTEASPDPPIALGSGLPVLTMRLQAKEGATGRPEEVVDALGIIASAVRILRERLIFHNI
jgi:radical SAM-linked protein